MTDGHRSFWSSIPGLITGLAGLLTGVVGLGTLAVQQGIIGGKDSGSTTNTTVVTGPGTAGATATTEVGSFTMTPATLNFAPADAKEKFVTVKNTSGSTPITVQTPRVGGNDAGRFTASYGTCTGAPLKAGLSCTLKVTFTPSGALKKFDATLQVTAEGAPQGAEVPITASTLL